MAKKKLGRGLSSLLQVPPETNPSTSNDGIVRIPLAAIVPNRYQPRDHFDDERIVELSRSIQSQGLLQPITVRHAGSQYELLAGERRFRACRKLGWDSVPALIKNVDDLAAMEIALIENIQREDLNPLERARAYLTLTKQFSLSHEQVAQRVGLNRSSVSNLLRLLDLEPEIQEFVEKGSLSMGHARALLAIEGGEERLLAAQTAVAEGLSVRDVEQWGSSRSEITPKRTPAKASPGKPSAHLRDLESQIESTLGTKARIQVGSSPDRGKIVLHYYSQDDFSRIIERIR
ncbi:MAG: ParB/RepB/Spo0J family partition protein [Planctomycetota bacterium]|jgi:ParB family chromosome partitioning protein|nr:ParB/RepB/Spo0J family partition protein [Planctomycetota bacterium]